MKDETLFRVPRVCQPRKLSPSVTFVHLDPEKISRIHCLALHDPGTSRLNPLLDFCKIARSVPPTQNEETEAKAENRFVFFHLFPPFFNHVVRRSPSPSLWRLGSCMGRAAKSTREVVRSAPPTDRLERPDFRPEFLVSCASCAVRRSTMKREELRSHYLQPAVPRASEKLSRLLIQMLAPEGKIRALNMFADVASKRVKA